MKCPKCGAECWADSVDIGVGVIYGPYGCADCGWSQDSRFDKTNPEHQSIQDGYYADPWGGATPVLRIIERADHFGLVEAAEKAFLYLETQNQG